MECHHPNWRTHLFQRGRYTTNQIMLDMLVEERPSTLFLGQSGEKIAVFPTFFLCFLWFFHGFSGCCETMPPSGPPCRLSCSSRLRVARGSGTTGPVAPRPRRCLTLQDDMAMGQNLWCHIWVVIHIHKSHLFWCSLGARVLTHCYLGLLCLAVFGSHFWKNGRQQSHMAMEHISWHVGVQG